MITFEIGDKEYEIKELTIRQYYEVEQYLISSSIKEHYEVISRLSGCPIKDLKTLRMDQWSLLWTTLVEILSQYFTQDMGNIVQELEHDGVQYGLIKLDEVTIGEFADLDVILAADNSKQRLHEVLAILYRPIIGRGFRGQPKIKPYAEINNAEQSEIFKDLPIRYVKSALSFFLLSGNLSLVNTVDYLVKEVRKNKDLPVPIKKELLALARKLLEDGGEQLTSSPEKMSSILKRLRSSTYDMGLTGSPGRQMKLKNKKNWIDRLLQNIGLN